MHWVVGIDEAGYGPNLGPLVQTAIAVRLPREDAAGWDTLRPWVRRVCDADDGRILVDDSKQVNQGKNGLLKLERGIAALCSTPTGSFADWLAPWALPGVFDDLAGEAWFDPLHALPVGKAAFLDLKPALHEAGIETRIVGVKLMPTPIFNSVIAGSGSKGMALAIGLIGLLTAARQTLPASDPIQFYCDKQGGRTFYAPVLQAAFPDGWVVTECETALESRYRIESLGQDVAVTIQPRADGSSIAVALASMLAKYLRELCMAQFNAFWAKHVPGLKPTAGYPVDAKRFLADIRPAMEKLGLDDHAVWRCR